MLFVKEEPPLHLAVLHDDLEQLKALAQNEALKNVKNWLGYTALELAYLLYKTACINILHPEKKRLIQISPPHQTTKQYDPVQFEEKFGLRYLSHLHFATYPLLQKAIRNCPWIIKSTALGEENRTLGMQYQEQISSGYVADVTIRWINETIGYGLFANEEMAKGTYIGEYTGQVRRMSRVRPDYNAYCFHYPTRLWSWNYFVIDAQHEGNELRFINHSPQPNLQPVCLFDRGLLHLAFITNDEVKAGEQLTFDYGPDYWVHRTLVS